ncbi:response regulator transcription factor [Sphingomonas baiyangensis]|uniref:Response regulator transcription factor n=1 Tax=Sphingomonas baiyangensis TaxID=2572576 RepID=A0A4U1L5L8_9SPHN|nr:response regulator [Sphingomonas baiyangensis]TKD51593.1 response regulator transcription factor [Sphingomonas baiyangensis]
MTIAEAERNVFLVDDDNDVRDELATALSMRGFAVRAFADGETFLAVQNVLPGGCVVLDLNMPGLNGMDVQAALAERDSAHKVVVLTGSGSVPAAVRAMHAGAIDFIEKPFRIEDLVRAIGRALTHQRQSLREANRRREAQAQIDRLSERERDVLAGMVLGLANKIIAYRLGLSVRTVETYRAHVMDKLAVRSLAEAVQIAIDAELSPKGDILRVDPVG